MEQESCIVDNNLQAFRLGVLMEQPPHHPQLTLLNMADEVILYISELGSFIYNVALQQITTGHLPWLTPLFHAHSYILDLVLFYLTTTLILACLTSPCHIGTRFPYASVIFGPARFGQPLPNLHRPLQTVFGSCTTSKPSSDSYTLPNRTFPIRSRLSWSVVEADSA
jgi:hypothetical protein